MKTFFIKTLGCKSNQYDSQRLRETLLKNGFDEVGTVEEAECLLLNHCGVTAKSVQKARRFLSRCHRENPALIAVVLGCIAKEEGAALSREGLIRAAVPGHDPMAVMKALGVTAKNAVSAADGVSGFSGRTRAFVKIQNGCDASCTYCRIRFYRGKPVSRSAASLFEEVDALCANGFREMVLTGTHIGLYGTDQTGLLDLADLVGELASAFRECRFRLSSLEPREYSGMMPLFQEFDNICPHLHLPLQSGSDAILSQMKRQYTRHTYLDMISQLRNACPGLSISTDVIVGFPGERPSDFSETVSLCKEARYSKVHVFPFSPRPGTPAASMDGVVSKVEKMGRVRELLSVVKGVRAEVMAESVGTVMDVIPESQEGDLFRGMSGSYFPVRFSGGAAAVGKRISVRIDGLETDEFYGVPVE